MADLGHRLTDAQLEALEKKIAREYAIAARDMRKKLRDYMDQFEDGKAIQKALLDAGKITKKEYKDWVFRHTMMGQQWRDMKNVLAEDLQRASEISLRIARGQMADIYALNANFATYQIEHDFGLDTGFTLYNHDTAEYLLEQQRQLMPGPSTKKAKEIAANKSMQWNKDKIQSAVLQGVLQGESPFDVAKRLTSVAQMDYNASVRYARTMTTSAQNAGRYQSYRRAKSLGVDLTIEWQATLDGRTRHEHRLMHGQRKDVDEPFVVDGVEILYPAQSDGPGASDIPQSLIWNCRCTLLAWVKGFEGDTVKSSPKMEGMSFDEWQKAKMPKTTQQAGNVAPQLTTPPAKAGIVRDNTSTLATAIGQDQYDDVCDMLDACQNDDVRKLYSTHLNSLDADPNWTGGAYHQRGKLYYNGASDAHDTISRKKHSTFFHEAGHGCDYKISRANGTWQYYSEAWQGGKFSKTIHDEVDAWVNQKATELKAGFAAHRTDVAWLKANGFLSSYGESQLKQYCSYYGVDLDDILSGKHKVTHFMYKSYVPSYSKSMAYKAVEKEVSDLIAKPGGDYACHSLSDIINGASKGKIKPGWGHKDSYWQQIDVCIEAFAEMSEAYVSGPESLAMIGKYLPKSLTAYNEMVAEYVGGLP